MHTQHDLFRGFGRVHATQGTLFEAGARESSIRCDRCGAWLVETESGYLCCPNGHGRLLVAEEEGRHQLSDDVHNSADGPSGLWFQD